MRRHLILLILPAAAIGAVRNPRVSSTNTQAVLTYTAPTTASCEVEVSQSTSYRPLVPDTNPALFTNSNIDTRAGNVVRGQERQFVIGKRAAERALDGRKYSRVLESGSVYYYRITCGTDTAEGSFTTQNIAAGMNYNDPLPADPNNPGSYAWPDLSWTNRNTSTTDPHTGALIHGLTLPTDRHESGSGTLSIPIDRDSAWGNAAYVQADDGNAATFSGSGSNWLFLPTAINVWNGGKHTNDNGSLNYLQSTINAWCSGAGCDTASVEDRTIQACLTANGVSCSSDMIEHTLAACSSGCTGSSYRFTLGDTTPILAAWGTLRFDRTSVHGRTGNVNRNGAGVTYASGDYFDLNWTYGSKIAINGTTYEIASIDSPSQLTLAGSPAGTESNVAYSTSNFGLLVRKKSSSTHQISLQYAARDYAIGYGVGWDSAGDAHQIIECSAATVAGPGGEQGYHCHISGSLYWIGRDTGTVSLLGNMKFPYRGGTDGWSSGLCWVNGGAYFDPANANVFYCAMTGGSNDLVLVSATYHGSNVDVGPQGALSDLVECNPGVSNQPCFSFENLTPASQNKSITQQVAAFNAEWNSSPIAMNKWNLFGQQGGILGLYARSADTNDVLGWFAMFQMSDRSIIAAAPSWKHWPFRWSTLHGASPIQSSEWMLFSGHISKGNYSGSDAYGRGPWRSIITNGAVGTTGTACPARPSDSPIPAENWPTGNKCIQVTVSGEPCDPSPAGEATNPTKCGNSSDGYLMDAEVRDVFCGSDNPANGCGLYATTEVFRLILKNGNTWTLQRAYSEDGDTKPMLALNSNASLVAIPPSCQLGLYPCGVAFGYWNFAADPYGLNSGGSSFLIDRANFGGGHSTLSNNGQVDSVHDGCSTVDGQSNGCYSVRLGAIPAIFGNTGYVIANNPAFSGLTGIGQPNEVDGHPSQPAPTAGAWFADARPFLGHATATGSSGSPGAAVSGSLLKFTAAQVWKLRRKQLPTLASCGSHPLLDISGPSSAIGGTSTDNYKYCVANAAGECYEGSSAGDVYVNCPTIQNRYCYQLPAGNENYDADNVCVTDNGAYTQGITQVDMRTEGLSGAGGRLITHALSAYRLGNAYWNVKGTPDGRWLIVQSSSLGGQRSDALLVKLPPIPVDSVNRATVVPVSITVRPPTGLNVSNAVVEFGNNAGLQCTSRQEICVKGNQAANGYAFASEMVEGVPCSAGCTVTVPGIAQRTLYYRVKYRNAANQIITSGSPSVVVVP